MWWWWRGVVLYVEDAGRHVEGKLSVAKPEYMKGDLGRDYVIILK